MITYDDFSETLIDQDVPVSEWSIAKIGTLNLKLDNLLNYNKARFNNYGFAFQKLSLTTVLNLCNESFGFDGWSTQIVGNEIIAFDENVEENRYSMQMTTIVRLTLKDGTFHESVGIAKSHNLPSKSLAFTKCKKESYNDAIKKCVLELKDILLDHEKKL
ncbi:hypothetical protein PACTADRAFT_2256 [Pachysolen tannophilus NRRL Y-2460]|uniref:DNA repair and recombination protein RAD52 n=1 Tax=Pachysolen tannophilus NRRL Y-2460 TaxID=669874 RepID=A0A1E4TVZ3_PACTA|nr:hypothetical protein PACTADRAFT_2256 [Pachysolen tannophilus NRRL Y-2460]